MKRRKKETMKDYWYRFNDKKVRYDYLKSLDQGIIIGKKITDDERKEMKELEIELDSLWDAYYELSQQL